MSAQDSKSVIQLTSEELTLSKKRVEGETVRVHIESRQTDHALEVTTAHEIIRVETVEIGREITEAPQIRTEGNVTIIPVIEEEAVIVKRLILRKEVRLTRLQTEETVLETIPLRSEEAVIERLSPSATNPLENYND